MKDEESRRLSIKLTEILVSELASCAHTHIRNDGRGVGYRRLKRSAINNLFLLHSTCFCCTEQLVTIGPIVDQVQCELLNVFFFASCRFVPFWV